MSLENLHSLTDLAYQATNGGENLSFVNRSGLSRNEWRGKIFIRYQIRLIKRQMSLENLHSLTDQAYQATNGGENLHSLTDRANQSANGSGKAFIR
jgi:hypothetical protein